MRNKYKGKDIQSRLSGTVIRYKGHPYLCECDDGGVISLYSLEGEGLVARIDPEDSLIDISSLPLGYVNIDHPDYKLAVYLKREATRQYKQGVELNRLTQLVQKTGVSSIHHKILHGKGLVDCVLNRYPTFTTAMTMITKNGYVSVALSRDIAVKREADLLKVWMKDTEVGYIKIGTNKVVVPDGELAYYYKIFLSDIKEWKV